MDADKFFAACIKEMRNHADVRLITSAQKEAFVRSTPTAEASGLELTEAAAGMIAGGDQETMEELIARFPAAAGMNAVLDEIWSVNEARRHASFANGESSDFLVSCEDGSATTLQNADSVRLVRIGAGGFSSVKPLRIGEDGCAPFEALLAEGREIEFGRSPLEGAWRGPVLVTAPYPDGTVGVFARCQAGGPLFPVMKSITGGAHYLMEDGYSTFVAMKDGVPSDVFGYSGPLRPNVRVTAVHKA
jgi:hypothetical protein